MLMILFQIGEDVQENYSWYYLMKFAKITPDIKILISGKLTMRNT